MTMLQYETQVPLGGYITLPPEYHERRVVVRILEEKKELGGSVLERLEGTDKTPEQDFLDFCEELAMPSLSDEEVEQIKYERRMRKML